MNLFYSHVNYSVTKIMPCYWLWWFVFYSHVNYSVTKIMMRTDSRARTFYSHVNYSVTKIPVFFKFNYKGFTVT